MIKIIATVLIALQIIVSLLVYLSSDDAGVDKSVFLSLLTFIVCLFAIWGR